MNPGAILQAGQAEKRAAAIAKTAAVLLAQANRDRLQTVTPPTPQSNATMHSSDSAGISSSDDDADDGGGEDGYGKIDGEM